MKIAREDFQQRLLPILIAQATGLLCGLAGVRLASHLVSPADYGRYGVFVSLTPIGASVVYIGLVKHVTRYWQETPDHSRLLRDMLAAALRRLPWLVVPAVGLALCLGREDVVSTAALLTVAALLLSLTQLGQAALQAVRAHWRDCGVSAGISIARSFLPPLLYVAWGAGFLALTAGFALHALLGTLLVVVSLYPWWRVPPAAAAATRLAPAYGGPQFAFLAVTGWIVASANRWLVAGFAGPAMAGYFTLAGNIGIILPAMLGLVLQQYHQPDWFAPAPGGAPNLADLRRKIDRVALLYTGVALTAAILLHLVVPWLVGPLISERFAPAAQFVLAVGCFTTALTIGSFYHVLLLAAKRERACVAVDLPGGLCLLLGGLVTAALGLELFKVWLVLSPVVPWLVHRPLAHRALRGDA